MGFLDFLLGTAFVMNVLDTRDPKRPRNVTPVDDGSFKAYQNPRIQTLEFPTGFGNVQRFILAVAGP